MNTSRQSASQSPPPQPQLQPQQFFSSTPMSTGLLRNSNGGGGGSGSSNRSSSQMEEARSPRSPPPPQYQPPLVEQEEGEELDEKENNLKVVTRGNYQLSSAKKKVEEEQNKANPVLKFIRRHPILFVLIMSVIIVLIVLAIVLPLTLVKPKAERAIKPRCPDGKTQARIDCLPDRNALAQAGTNQESACRQRGCCWSPEGGGSNCAFPFNYGFRQVKVKERSATGMWYELTRMEAPNSLARSDIANLEFKIEMQTDYRLRIKVKNQFFFFL